MMVERGTARAAFSRFGLIQVLLPEYVQSEFGWPDPKKKTITRIDVYGPAEI
jgi:hypothetical protein